VPTNACRQKSTLSLASGPSRLQIQPAKIGVVVRSGKLSPANIAVFHNRSRRHSSLGYLSPTAFLQNWIERQSQQEMAA
jgi:hypothetical protein